MHFQTHRNLVKLPTKGVDTIVACVRLVLAHHSSSARTWLRLLGLLNAAAFTVPDGRLFLRPLQLFLLAHWKSGETGRRLAP